ncbi:MAG: hypothetical protein ACFFBP_05520 [Promethearchaeota archaeon]
MNEKKGTKNEKEPKSNKFLIGPGFGLAFMGAFYLIWWIFIASESLIEDPRWAHNLAYAIIILTVGLAFYKKSVVSRSIALIQSFFLPVVGSGSFNTIILTIITIVIFTSWLVVVIIEKIRDKMFLQEKLQKRTWLWLNLHTLVLAWILIAHMGLMFIIVRFPLEAELYTYDPMAAYLANLPPESLEFGTWVFDITLFIWAVLALWEQFKMGYNIQNKPWPRYSFYMAMVCMGASLLALLIQQVTIGFQWVNLIYP